MKLQRPFEDSTDALIAERLQKLSALPVDTTSLDRALMGKLPPGPAHATSIHRRRWISLISAAASLLLLASLSLPLLQNRNAQASYLQMAQMHQDMLSGAIPTMHAQSMDEANQAIAAMAGNFPKLPDAPDAHTMACCMRNVGNRRVACVLLNAPGTGETPVTMVVANTADVEAPTSAATFRNGIAYYVQSIGNLHMVVTERDHRRICFVGAVPTEQLMTLAAGVKF